MSEQLSMFDHTPRDNARGRRGWFLVERGACGATWAHDSSPWVVQHCGHPTALWPWLPINSETGEQMRHKPSGRAFRELVAAQTEVELRVYLERQKGEAHG